MLAALLFGALALGAVACSHSTQARGWAAPVQAEDTLLVSTSKGRLDGIDADTRDPLWRFPNRWNIPDDKARKFGGFYGAPVLSSDGDTVFIGDYNGYIYAFQPDDLNQNDTSQKPNAASFKLNGPVIGGMVLDPSGDRLYVTSGERVFSVSASDLTRRIENRDATVDSKEIFKTAGEIWSTPVLQGNRLFFASLDGNLYAINTSGEEAWRFTGARSLVSTPVVAGTTLLVGGFDDRLHAIDMSTGTQRWEYVAANWIWGAPLIDGTRLYVGDFDGTVHAVNLSDGSKIWSINLSDRPLVSSPVLADGVLVVASQDGELFGIDPATQARRWGPTPLHTALIADLVKTNDGVLLAPTGCTTPPGESEKRYYITVEPTTGDLAAASGVC